MTCHDRSGPGGRRDSGNGRSWFSCKFQISIFKQPCIEADETVELSFVPIPISTVCSIESSHWSKIYTSMSRVCFSKLNLLWSLQSLYNSWSAYILDTSSNLRIK